MQYSRVFSYWLSREARKRKNANTRGTKHRAFPMTNAKIRLFCSLSSELQHWIMVLHHSFTLNCHFAVQHYPMFMCDTKFSSFSLNNPAPICGPLEGGRARNLKAKLKCFGLWRRKFFMLETFDIIPLFIGTCPLLSSFSSIPFLSLSRRSSKNVSENIAWQ